VNEFYTLKNLARRIELAERAAVAQSQLSENCICFPAKEPAIFDSDEQQEAAYRIKCPLHGDRSQKLSYLFRAPWRKEREAIARKNRSAQYKKAWIVSGL
jgi:hypothetical protein